MEHRNSEITSAQDAHADDTMRALLARYQQPTAVSPPTVLAQQIIAQLPNLSPAQAAQVIQRRQRRRVITTMSTALVLACLTTLGAWGAFINSSSPALLFGGTDTTLGYLVLVLTLAVKPLVGVLASLSTPTFATSIALLAAGGWGWWYLARRTPALVASGAES